MNYNTTLKYYTKSIRNQYEIMQQELKEEAISIIRNNEEFKEAELCKLMDQGLNIHRPINENGDMIIHSFVHALFESNI